MTELYFYELNFTLQGGVPRRAEFMNNNMVHSCCMVGCPNRQDKEAGISLHRIPHYPVQRRETWIKIINRAVREGGEEKQWRPSNSARVCSIHFLEGKHIFFHGRIQKVLSERVQFCSF